MVTLLDEGSLEHQAKKKTVGEPDHADTKPPIGHEEQSNLWRDKAIDAKVGYYLERDVTERTEVKRRLQDEKLSKLISNEDYLPND